MAKLNRRLVVACAAIVFTGAVTTLFLLKTTLPIVVVAPLDRHSVDRPLTIELNQKLGSLDISKLRISPQVEGEWSYTPGTMLENDSISFTPESIFTPDTKYTAEIDGIQRVLAGSTDAASVSFYTEEAPDIASSSGKTDKPLGARTPFSVTFSAPNNGVRLLELTTKPAVRTTPTSDDDTTFRWTPEGMWPQGKKVEVLLTDARTGEKLLATKVAIVAEPKVSKPVKQTYFTDKDTADITFSQPIDTQRAPKIKFDLKGEGKWISQTVYRFTPEDAQPGSTYNYVVPKGVESQDGGVMTKEYNGTFSTTGEVSLAGYAPIGNGVSQASQDIRFTFDQAVDKRSAEQRVSISHGTTGEMRWSGNTLTVPVSNLGYQQRVIASIKPGVKNAEFGLPSTRTLSFTFDTEIRSKRLAIPYFSQQHAATCTVASLRMALAYRGVTASEMGIVSKMGYKPRSIDKSTNPPTWDDPNEMFVGSVDGSITNGTAAGPDAPPVAKASMAYGRSASVQFGASIHWIAAQIYAGNPVVMFGAKSPTSGTTTWKTPTGKSIVMNLTSHATLVTGVHGEPSSPLGFWVNDPLAGGPAYWSAATVASNITRDPARQAVSIK